MSIFADLPVARYAGPASTDPYLFRAYDAARSVLGKPMGEWLRCAVCYWHSFSWPGNDIFGGGTLPRPWLGPLVTPEMARARLEGAFEFLVKLGVPYFTFHDVDAMATATTLAEHERNLQQIEAQIADRMAATGVKLLWGTANLFSHARYAGG
jgi:xylose isomerase